MAEIQGTCDDQFAGVRDAMAASLDKGKDLGASVAIVRDGELVVDLWAGDLITLDGEQRPWQRDTLVNVYSTTKTMTNLSCLVLADRGLVDLDAPVATFWPEFAANGKEAVLVRHLLAHTSGVAGFDEPLIAEDLYDWDKCCKLLAAQAPWWEPGTRSGYHALTQGYLVGEVIRRTTGKTPGTFFREEIAEPLGADFHIGTPASCDDRVSRLVPPPTSEMPFDGEPGNIAYRIWSNPRLEAEDSWTERWRRAEIPAANGHGNARSVACVQSIVSHNGEVEGIRLLSPATIDRIFEVQMEGQPDLGVGYPLTFGIGYGLITHALPVAPIKRGCFWAGMGGSMVVNDLDHRMTIAYVMNKMSTATTGDSRAVRAIYAAYANLGGLMGADAFDDAVAAGVESLQLVSKAIADLPGRSAAGLKAAAQLVIARSGSLVVTGLGKSGLVGAKLAATLASTGTLSYFVHSADALHGDSGMVSPNDVLLALSYRGETAEVVAFARMAAARGVPVISLTGCGGNSSLAKLATVALDGCIEREGDPHNLAPTVSTSVALALGDALAITLMVARGFGPDDFKTFHPGGSLGRLLDG